MNEKEFERLILDNTFVGRVASFTKEHPDGEPAVRGARAAAHAIAEKMAERVVFSKSGEIRVNYAAGATEVIYQNGNLWSGIRIAEDTLDELDGQRATVTVTKEE